MSEERRQRSTQTGVVDRGPRNKTIVVRSVELVEHPKYHRYVRRATLYRVHDEKQQARMGDTVEIMQSRPISKTKHWRLVRVVSRGRPSGKRGQAVIQEQTRLDCADNTGRQDRLLLQGARRHAAPLRLDRRHDRLLGQEGRARRRDRGRRRSCGRWSSGPAAPVRRPDGSYVRFDRNARSSLTRKAIREARASSARWRASCARRIS